jgi:hypothetical protein
MSSEVSFLHGSLYRNRVRMSKFEKKEKGQ